MRILFNLVLDVHLNNKNSNCCGPVSSEEFKVIPSLLLLPGLLTMSGSALCDPIYEFGRSV